MRRLIVILFLLSLAFPVSVQAKASCWVEPNPVPLGGAFTVYATGLTPNAWYFINITQAKDNSNGAHPNGGIFTDETGYGYGEFPSTSWSPDGIIGVGAAKARVYSKPALGEDRGSGTANCAFTVVP